MEEYISVFRTHLPVIVISDFLRNPAKVTIFFLESLFFLRPSTCIELRVQDVLNGKSSKLVVTHGEILYVHRSTFPYASPLS